MDNKWRTRESEEFRRGKPFSEQETNVFTIPISMVFNDGAILFYCGFGFDGGVVSNLFSMNPSKFEKIDIDAEQPLISWNPQN